MSYRGNFKSLSKKVSKQSSSAHARRVARGLLVRAARRMARPGRAMLSARIARQLGRIELKGMDTDIVAALPNAAVLSNLPEGSTGIIPLNLIQQGAGSFNRIGRKVALHSVRLSGRVNLLVTVADGNIGPNMCRMAIVWDKQPSGALPVYTDIFGRTDQEGVETTQILDPLRYDNTDRFRVLLDRRIELNPGFSSAGPAQSTVACCDVNEYVRLNGRETVFSGQSDPMEISDISSGALYLILRSTSQATTSRVSVTQFMSRLRYKD